MNTSTALLRLVVRFKVETSGVVGASDACRAPRHSEWHDVDQDLRWEARMIGPPHPPER